MVDQLGIKRRCKINLYKFKLNLNISSQFKSCFKCLIGMSDYSDDPVATAAF